MNSVAFGKVENKREGKSSEGRDSVKAKDVSNRRKYIRKSIELHPDVEDLLDVLQDRMKARSHTEVLQKAIQLLAVAVGREGSEETKIFLSKGGGPVTEIVIL